MHEARRGDELVGGVAANVEPRDRPANRELERPHVRPRERSQPVAQGERGAAVLLVVGGDPVEESALAGLEPALVVDDRLAAAADVRAAGEPGVARPCGGVGTTLFHTESAVQ